MYTVEDTEFMKLALKLAIKARGNTFPNPLVGAVIVNKGRVVGKGYHKKAGTPHAEIHALEEAGDMAKGATLYVNLEPCSHEGKTPPCVNAIIRQNISRVVIGMSDPNPLVNGKGIKILQDSGIKVSVGLLEKQAKKINEIFIKYITSRLPFITLKAAVSIDGKICSKTGESKWITNEQSRQYVHKQRFYHNAVMVGINTIIKDDPHLTCRLENKKTHYPYRIILDSSLKINLMANILQDKYKEKIIIATTENADEDKLRQLQKTGINVIITGKTKVNIADLLKILGKREITSIMVEGGSTVFTSLIEDDMFDKILLFIAPKIIGGKNALTITEGSGIESIQSAKKLKLHKIHKFEDDIMLEYNKL